MKIVMFAFTQSHSVYLTISFMIHLTEVRIGCIAQAKTKLHEHTKLLGAQCMTQS